MPSEAVQSPELSRRSRWVRGGGITVFLLMFLVGYNATGPGVRECSAAVSAGGPAPTVSGGTCGDSCCYETCIDVCDVLDPLSCRVECTTTCPPAVPCDPTGTARKLTDKAAAALKADLVAAAAALEAYLGDLITKMLYSLYMQIERLEQDMISWWKTMWSYNLLPSMQNITRQMNTDVTMQMYMHHANADASGQMEVNLAMQKHAVEDERNLRPSGQVCVAATAVAGQGRASSISRAMREGWESESLALGLNKLGSIGATGYIKSEGQRALDYKNLFCDPDGNGGRNNCGPSDPLFYNADVQPTRFMYNQLTIDATNPKQAKTIESIINNMVGFPSAEPILKGALDTDMGHQNFLARRSYLARYAAVRSVPQLVSGWRMPGSRMGDWVKDLRMAAGVPLPEVSTNPSYKEILHAVSVDRFNSGKYAAGMITNESQIEMEKLTLNAFYLMQLRDYYELLERTALILAVQVSIRAEIMPMPDVVSATPKQQQ